MNTEAHPASTSLVKSARPTRPLFAALAIMMSFAANAAALDAQELVEKNIAARGGLDALKGIESLTRSGIATFGGGDFSVELAVKSMQSRPANMRMEATFQGMTLINAYDGKEAWTISPFQGRVDPQRKSADESKLDKLEADIEGVLINAQQKGYKIDYLGQEDVDGTNAHKLRVRLNDNDTRFVYLDPDHFLEIRFEDRVKVRGAESVSITDVGDYEKVNGWYVPFFFDTQGQKISFDKIEANVKLDPAQFAFPAKK